MSQTNPLNDCDIAVEPLTEAETIAARSLLLHPSRPGELPVAETLFYLQYSNRSAQKI